jgi:hypothetical protein
VRKHLTHREAKIVGSKGQVNESLTSDELLKALAESVKSSGFPFQAKIQDLIESQEDWQVLANEFPWRDEKQDGFIDIVAESQSTFLIIECKKKGFLRKSQSGSNGTTWPQGSPKESYVFLRRNADKETNAQTKRITVTHYRQEQRSDTPDIEHGLQAEDRQYEPPSYETSLCVTAVVDKSQETIERIVSTLARSCHAYASDYFSNLWNDPGNEAFLPVLVTTSPLFVVDFDPARVSIKDGAFDLQSHDICSVPWIRFRKAFMTLGSQNLDDRTILVVHAEHFQDFLSKLHDETRYNSE